jgi:energy-coupling factor transporter ATP-binding protein EcfA2
MIWKVLKTNPRFIIIDEPEKGIDEDTMCKIMDYIIKTYSGTIFLITHNETIKKRYSEKIQSRIEYKFDNNLYGEEINTQIYQI